MGTLMTSAKSFEVCRNSISLYQELQTCFAWKNGKEVGRFSLLFWFRFLRTYSAQYRKGQIYIYKYNSTFEIQLSGTRSGK